MSKLPRIRIATDSVSDMPASLAQELGIAVVPATITCGGKTYREGIDLTREQFYGELMTRAELPKTAAPGPGAFADAYRNFIAEHRQAGIPLDAIISLHPPANLSALYTSAYVASHMIEETQVIVVDTGQLSMGIGLMAVAAAQAAQAGHSLVDIMAMIEQMKRRTVLLAGLETLEWAARSGRINRLVAALGNLLSVKPILKVEGGEITLAERVRTHTRQLERVLEMVRALAPVRDIAVMHARVPDLAERIADMLADLYPRSRMVVAEIGCILGSYTGPGAYGIIAVRE